MVEWQPIETAPKDGDTPIIVFNGVCISLGHFYENEFYDSVAAVVNEHGDEMHPTHWMPLPAPPCNT